MKTVSQIFRRHNFFIVDSIMNDGTLFIEGKMAVDPLDKIFDKPIKCKSPKNKKINGSNS